MTKDEMQEYLRSIISGEAKNGIEIFVCLKIDSVYSLKKLIATNQLLDSVDNKLINTLKEKHLSEEIEYDSSDNIADNKKSLYEVIQDNEYHPFLFLENYKNISEKYSDNDRKALTGLFFRINLNDCFFWIYQHVYSVSKIDRSNHIFAIRYGNVYTEINKEILHIGSRIDFLIIENSIITDKVDLLQKHFSFESYIRTGAKKTIDAINNLGIVSGMEKFISFEDKTKLTNAKKLLKARNSKVLKMEKKTLFKRLKKHSRYSKIFVFKDNQIIINSQKDVEMFIKMLNDDILKSELTGQDYDSPIKSALES